MEMNIVCDEISLKELKKKCRKLKRQLLKTNKFHFVSAFIDQNPYTPISMHVYVRYIKKYDTREIYFNNHFVIQLNDINNSRFPFNIISKINKIIEGE